MKTREQAIEHLKSAIEIMSTVPFVEDYVRDDNKKEREIDGLGILIAGHTQWDGIEIMRIFYAALEDANFHKEAEKVQQWIDQAEGK